MVNNTFMFVSNILKKIAKISGIFREMMIISRSAGEQTDLPCIHHCYPPLFY